MSTVASYYKVKADKLYRTYKKKISDYKSWEQKGHAEEYLIYPQNVSEYLAIDEVSLSKGELYTFVTSKASKNKGKLVAVINGTESKKIIEVLLKINESLRNKVTEVSLDMARNMELSIKTCFKNATRVTDRFHVTKLVIDALQHLRVKYRWEAIEKENKEIKQARKKGYKYIPVILDNGDTQKELLARSRYLLSKLPHQWTLNQKQRAELLFDHYPLLKNAYFLCLEFRSIYECQIKAEAKNRFIEWCSKIRKSKIQEFNTAANSIQYHLENILNFFNNRSTNAHAESYNAKLKLFRANLRGVSDVKFFLFRIEKLFA